jgi:hypothetical protein
MPTRRRNSSLDQRGGKSAEEVGSRGATELSNGESLGNSAALLIGEEAN